MANNIELAKRFQPILDEIYKLSSVTAFLDGLTKPVENGGVAEVKIFKTSMTGLGNYSRSTGYVKGDVTGAWETIKLLIERGRQFNIDRQDNEESLGMAFGSLAGEFLRTHVVPEVDAVRFARWASAAGIQIVGTPATLSKTTILDAIDVAAQALDDEEVPAEGRVLFISSPCARFLNQAVERSLANENVVDRRVKRLDDMDIRPVPKSRFYTEQELDPGAAPDEGGFAPAADAAEINFLLMHPSARDQATKHANLKIFDPDTNQTGDDWLVQYRLYHDTWVYENKAPGIYLHHKAPPGP